MSIPWRVEAEVHVARVVQGGGLRRRRPTSPAAAGRRSGRRPPPCPGSRAGPPPARRRPRCRRRRRGRPGCSCSSRTTPWAPRRCRPRARRPRSRAGPGPVARARQGLGRAGWPGGSVAITVTVPKPPDGVRRSFSALLIRRPVAAGMVTRADWSVARPVAALMRIALPLAGLTLNSVIRRLPTLAVIDPFPASLTWSAESLSLRRPLRSTSAPLLSRRTAGGQGAGGDRQRQRGARDPDGPGGGHPHAQLAQAASAPCPPATGGWSRCRPGSWRQRYRSPPPPGGGDRTGREHGRRERQADGGRCPARRRAPGEIALRCGHDVLSIC